MGEPPVVEALLARHASGPTMGHMRGWEAFGVAPKGNGYRGDDDPMVRRLGSACGRDPDAHGKLDDWPEPELHGGIAGFHLSTHADDIGGAYLHVYGPNRDAVEACWYRVAALIPLDVWP